MQKLNRSAKIKDLLPERPISACKKISCSFDGAGELSDKADVEVIQFSKGKGVGEIQGLSDAHSQLLRVKYPLEATIRTELQPNKMHFTLPAHNTKTYLVNGLEADDTSIFFNYGVDETYIHAMERDSIVGYVPMDVFLDALGSILGKDRNDIHLPPKLVNLPSGIKKLLLHRLSILASGSNATVVSMEKHSPEVDLTIEVAYLVAQAAFYGDYDQAHNRSLRGQQNRVFKNAVDYYDAQIPGATSIADVCVALDLSAPTLIKAFRQTVGTTPKRYFALRRLARVRKELLDGSLIQSAVKRSSLKYGFLQPGQFSAFYKSVYDEMPSTTAGRSVD